MPVEAKGKETKNERHIRYAEEMNQKITELSGNMPQMSEDELGELMEEMVVTISFFKRVSDLCTKEKMRRTIEKGLDADKIDEESEEDISDKTVEDKDGLKKE